jgi:hypothetical protein
MIEDGSGNSTKELGLSKGMFSLDIVVLSSKVYQRGFLCVYRYCKADLCASNLEEIDANGWYSKLGYIAKLLTNKGFKNEVISNGLRYVSKLVNGMWLIVVSVDFSQNWAEANELHTMLHVRSSIHTLIDIIRIRGEFRLPGVMCMETSYYIAFTFHFSPWPFVQS